MPAHNGRIWFASRRIFAGLPRRNSTSNLPQTGQQTRSRLRSPPGYPRIAPSTQGVEIVAPYIVSFAARVYGFVCFSRRPIGA